MVMARVGAMIGRWFEDDVDVTVVMPEVSCEGDDKVGEQVYPIQTYEGDWLELIFSENDDKYACLCRFPDYTSEMLEVEDVRSLALFGAAVRLAFDGKLEHGLLPDCVPEWIRREIDEILQV